jgi:hypothetical protein
VKHELYRDSAVDPFEGLVPVKVKGGRLCVSGTRVYMPYDGYLVGQLNDVIKVHSQHVLYHYEDVFCREVIPPGWITVVANKKGKMVLLETTRESNCDRLVRAAVVQMRPGKIPGDKQKLELG